MDFLINTLEQGFIFGIMALGVFITYSILDFPDLSVDGTFALGAAVSASFLTKGVNPWIVCLLALVYGLIGGLITGIIHVKLQITNLLSGILVMISLYSINLRIMGKANVPLFNNKTIFSYDLSPILIILILMILVKLLIDLFFKTKLGYMLKATGDNHQLVTSLGVSIGWCKILGLMLSNGLVALAGSIMAQYQRFSDISMGNGTIIMGLAAIILGQSIFKRFTFVASTTVVIIGAVLYKGSIALALKIGLPPTDLKLITALIVLAAIVSNNKNFGKNIKMIFSKGGNEVA